jgi:hypothetical protein
MLGADNPLQARGSVAGLSQPSSSAHFHDDGFAFGATVDQIDRLSGLISSIRAYGDVISAGDYRVLAAGTLPALGSAIFEDACQIRALVSKLESQSLGGVGPAGAYVGESRPSYRAHTPFSSDNLQRNAIGAPSRLEARNLLQAGMERIPFTSSISISKFTTD